MLTTNNLLSATNSKLMLVTDPTTPQPTPQTPPMNATVSTSTHSVQLSSTSDSLDSGNGLLMPTLNHSTGRSSTNTLPPQDSKIMETSPSQSQETELVEPSSSVSPDTRTCKPSRDPSLISCKMMPTLNSSQIALMLTSILTTKLNTQTHTGPRASNHQASLISSPLTTTKLVSSESDETSQPQT